MGRKNRKVGEERLDELFTKMTLDLVRDPHEPAKAFAVSRLRERMRKRAEYHRPGLRDAALTAFLEDNERCRTASCTLDSRVEASARDFIRYALERFTSTIVEDSLQSCFQWSWILDNWAFGPGVSWDGDAGVGTVEKIDAPLSCTESARPFALRLRQTNPYFQSTDAQNGSDGVILSEGSRLTTVLKNEDTERTIGIEPSGNMLFQLAGGRYLEGALRSVGLDIRSQQPKNKVLARRGSIRGDVCTIDLKSASNLNIKPTMRALWPREWVSFIEKFRSPYCEVPGHGTHELHMVSSMGNGFTFPYMTLTILALVYANRYVNHNGPYHWIDYNHTAVFGDDIIVPTDEYETLVAVLQDAGFVVNADKSYVEGPFRESCGGDYYEGYDVTPFYVRRLAKPADVYVAINQVLRWCSKHSFTMFNTVRYLIGLLDGKVFLVPEWMQDTSGIRLAQCPRSYKHLRQRRVMRPYLGRYTLPLAVGGFIESRGDGASYSPRETWVRYKVGTARLPASYLDGWDPLYGSQCESSFRSLLVAMAS